MKQYKNHSTKTQKTINTGIHIAQTSTSYQNTHKLPKTATHYQNTHT